LLAPSSPVTDHRIVAKPDVLARARKDLAQGHTDVAIRRLRGYLATEPNSLEVRRVLAAIYRQTGNYAEAGRWGYLTADVRPVELAAFERANPSPFIRLRMLNYTADKRHLPAAAQDRLRVLTVQAERVGPPPGWGKPPPPQPDAPKRRSNRVPCLYVVIALTVLGTLAAIGVYRLIMWLIAL
jgi:Tetratricopeptide repeat